MSLRRRGYLSEYQLPPPGKSEKKAGRPDGAITKVSQIDPKKFYTLWERIHGNWLVDRTYSGVFFRGEGSGYLKSKDHAVVLRSRGTA